MSYAIRTLLFGSIETTDRRVHLVILLLRVFTGLALCTIFEKFMPRDGVWGPQAWFISDVAEMGFPFPVFFAWVAVLSEFFGGILLVIGLWTRPAAFLNLLVMVVATFWQNGGDISNKGLMSFTFLILCLSILLMGGGKYSVDQWIRSSKISTPAATLTVFLLSIGLSTVPLVGQNSANNFATAETVSFKLKNNSLLPKKIVLIIYRPDEFGNQTRMPFFLPFGKRKYELPVGSKVFAATPKQIDLVMSGASIQNETPLVLVTPEIANATVKVRIRKTNKE
ncbi:MAG: DoxX family protein [Bacteroidota bacterium]